MKVRRANVVLTVSENEINKYLARGYDIMDDSGKVIKHHIPNDVNSLQVAYRNHENEIKALKNRIEELELQLQCADKNVNAVVTDKTIKRTRKKSEN